jgi:amino-acid N-acetyltransferase
LAKDSKEEQALFSPPLVNLGNFFGRARAVEESPVFSQYSDVQPDESQEVETLHVALVKLTAPEDYTDEVLEGIARTLSQLSRLSMAPCVVLDVKISGSDWRLQYGRQADRLLNAIDAIGGPNARRLDNILSFWGPDKIPDVFLRKLLLRPLRQGQIPIVMPLAYSDSTQKAEPIPASSAVMALTREFAGLNLQLPEELDPKRAADTMKRLQEQVSLDRIIIVDKHGGIPRIRELDRKQVFLNLEQEFHDIHHELNGLEDELAQGQHKSNLDLLRQTLQLLPPLSSGLITTPDDAANRTTIEQNDDQVSSVRTRRQKNTLIHNLLTDKPAYSSSLPSGRLSRTSNRSATPVISSTTFVKKGMPLTIYPDPNARGWIADNNGSPRLQLTDPRIDLSRLVHLIDDSFNRKLDVADYLKRVNDRIAGVIIAGEYEGGALLTWETPPGASDNDHARLVPYLDKFAVLKRSQGAGGVADILFNAMVRTCFPGGVCWRSRKDNPVNKWYFERSRGTWKLPETNWTMFWTTPGVVENNQLFSDYEGVCRGVQPSWDDNKKFVD